MITVTLDTPTGRDEAEADTPENAVFAGRTLWDEARDANPIQGFQRAMSLGFFVNGSLVRLCTDRP